MRSKFLLHIGWLAVALMTGMCLPCGITFGGETDVHRAALEYLARRMDQYHERYFVYDDYLSAGNHFVHRAVMCNSDDEASVPPMQEDWSQNPATGHTCIRCEFRAHRSNWGGWMFVNGILQGTNVVPELNWGETRGAGVSLQGAKRLVFQARGENGGERVKFFAFGIGRINGVGRPNKPYPDSSPQVSTGWVELSKDWKTYAIDLQGLDLSHVLLGFAWMTKATINGHQDVVFYLDDIYYEHARLDEPRFIVSFETGNSADDFDLVMRNAAFVYDNAVATLAFLAAGEIRRALIIADAFVYAQNHDRFFTDGRIRNAYQGGDLTLPPGWCPRGRRHVVRLPGWWDKTKLQWLEDATMVGTYAGNMAWTIIALASCYEASGDEKYLKAALRMGEWIEQHCRDERGNGGYTAGYEGWEPEPERLLYKSTEHNIDLVVAFSRLAELTGQPVWQTRSAHAMKFVLSMWDPVEGKFWTGTGEDGVSIFREVVPTDVQAWAVLALSSKNAPWLDAAIRYVEANCAIGDGFDFNQDVDGMWLEGTAHMACVYGVSGQLGRFNDLINALSCYRNPDGSLPAADRDYTSTGFHLRDGTPWVYFRRPHLATTAWYVLAATRQNPFYLDIPKRWQVAQSQNLPEKEGQL